MTIDMLDMLKARTQGNLDDKEARMLSDMLATLQMNFVQVRNEAPDSSDDGDTPAADDAPASPDEPEAEGAAPADDVAAGSESKEPKYHKSYGA